MPRVLLMALLLSCWSNRQAQSHDLSHSQSDIAVSGAEARARVQIDLVGFGGLQWKRRDVVSYDELDERIEQIVALLKEHLQATSTTPLVGTTVARYALIDNHVLDVDVVYRFDRPIDDLIVHSTLERITAFDHQHLARVNYGGRISDALLTAALPVARFERQTSRVASATTIWQASTRRVLTGTDYLAFLLLIVLAASTWRSLGTVLSAGAAASFCAAALAAANVLPWSSQSLAILVPVIVAVLAAVSLFGGRLLDQVMLASVFALIQMLLHVDALRQQAFSAGAIALPLMIFATGLVTTQGVVAVVAFSLLRRLAPSRLIRPTVSVVVGCLALYWLVQRSLPI